ncbi:hydrolase [Intrasporangium oryzae NRRL B-24470]|uniref:Hydrolase n=2 Tax=Intrasporangium TaxID=53357 RepID=W9G816_9MICO|nr:hydrolase [Intrasporangium oryzae NRRL B-24470]
MRNLVEGGRIMSAPSFTSSGSVGEAAGPLESAPDTRVMVLPDGRNLAWLDLGDPAGAAVVAFHGTPGSRLQLAFADGAASAAGVRLVVPDRPGYGLSGYQRRPTHFGWVEDVRRLADHVGLSTFAVLGTSGGGPHAAACARFLPERVRAAAIVSGVAPLAEAGTEAGMVPLDALLVRLSRRWGPLARPGLSVLATLDRRWPERMIGMMERSLGAADAAVMRRPEVRAALLSDLRASARTTGAAMAQDYALWARDWGFRLEDVTVPVYVWHGDADQDVPISQARRMAKRIPKSVLHECPGEGHLLVASHLQEILVELVGAESGGGGSAGEPSGIP